MSKDDVYQFMKEKTYNLIDESGAQLTITSEEIIEGLQLNEQTIYSNLKKLKKNEDIHYIINKITRYKEGSKFTFNQTVWWVE